MARDKNKNELQTNQRDQELREQEKDYKEEINLADDPKRNPTENDNGENREK